MVLFPPAKLNLGLHVLGKRDDGRVRSGGYRRLCLRLRLCLWR